MMKKTLPFLCCMMLLYTLPAVAEVEMPNIFGDHMVLQRETAIPVWGWAGKGEKVTVSLHQTSVSTRADAQGKWMVKLPAMPAGGPFVLTIQGDNQRRFEDVWVGEVWVCGGQSNMQWTVANTNYEEKDTAFVQAAPVRLFTVQVDMDYMPQQDIKGGAWKTLSQESLQHFSAVAYHFGKFLHQSLGVPIGLISSNLGATSVETWMSNEALLQFPQFNAWISPIVERGKSFAEINADFEATKSLWYQQHYYQGPGIEEEWFRPETDVSQWKTMELPNTWEDTELKDHEGAVWFHTAFDLPEDFTQDTFDLHLNQIDDYDIAWVNGHKIGETYGKHNHRNYRVPAAVLKPKDNRLVVRVFDIGGIGGFTTNAFWGNPILWGEWKYKKGLVIKAGQFPAPVVVNASPFSTPGVLYNANIAPLMPYAIKGVIWYQGEANVDRADEYRALFPAMIRDWRKHWGQGDFPFLFVQLANYMAELEEPADSEWAELREAQSQALALPHTGMAVTIDVGEADDIHPKNKEAVGIRLGKAALKVAYQQDKVSAGPAYASMQIKENKAIITFNHQGSGVVTTNKYGYIRGFEMAGADKKFYWAQAAIQDNKVVVSSDQVKVPVAVRYAWANNPGPLDLYNQEGLPAAPFRTDHWKGMTTGKKYTDIPRF